jgi:glycosyltransferase involved in cell wall biosynthesis
MSVLRLCVLAEDLPAGDDPVARVAAELSADHDVVVALTERGLAGPASLGSASVVAIGAVSGSFDVVLATSWQTTVHLFGVEATRYAELVSALEFEAMGGWQAERLAAQVALDLPVDFIAADADVQSALSALRPDARVLLGRLPLTAAESTPTALVLQGSPVPAMLAGSVPIVLPANSGPVEHMVSGLIAEPDDESDVVRLQNQVASDPDLAARLADGARSAVADWPSDASEIAAALAAIVASDPPESARWPHRLMGDLMAGVALLRQDHFAASAHIKRLENDEAYVAAQKVRQRVESSRPLRAIARRAKKRLL